MRNILLTLSIACFFSACVKEEVDNKPPYTVQFVCYYYPQDSIEEIDILYLSGTATLGSRDTVRISNYYSTDSTLDSIVCNKSDFTYHKFIYRDDEHDTRKEIYAYPKKGALIGYYSPQYFNENVDMFMLVNGIRVTLTGFHSVITDYYNGSLVRSQNASIGTYRIN